MNKELALELLQECGIKGNPNGKGEFPLNFCMFHEHNFGSPSLQVNLAKEVFYCYSCHQAGHIRRIFYQNGISAEFLYEGINTHDDFYTRLQDAVKDLEMPPEEVNNAESSELTEFRFLHPYLLRRGYSKELLVRNRIGFDRRSIRVTIPVYHDGRYFGCIKRSVTDVTPKYVYPKNFQKSALVYAPSVIKIKDKGIEIWTEGSLDALKAAQHGYYAKAILGCSISKRQLAMLEESPREIVLALDNDQAGWKGLDELLSATSRFDISILRFPQGIKDLGELSEEQLDYALKNRINRLELLDLSEIV